MPTTMDLGTYRGNAEVACCSFLYSLWDASDSISTGQPSLFAGVTENCDPHISDTTMSESTQRQGEHAI